jgi:hypothetical protein
MSKITWPVVLLFALCLAATQAQAQLARTFVSSSGSDANNCDRLTPCRTFQHAHNVTLASGEITVLDPGGYGAMTITKAISIINDGVGEAGILVSGGGTGISITAGASDAVSLRGLTIKGIGFGGGDGIVFNAGQSLSVENCTIRNLDGAGGGNGILFVANTSSALAVSNTVVTDNAADGVLVEPTGSASVNASFRRVEIYNSGGDGGLFVTSAVTTGAINAFVTDSIVKGSAGNGVTASRGSGSVNMTLLRSVIATNQAGVFAAGAGATLRVGQSTVTGNLFGWNAVVGGVLQSYGDNNVNGNNGNEAVMPILSKK